MVTSATCALASGLDQRHRRWNGWRRHGWAAVVLVLAGCARAAPPGDGVAIDPLLFFTGHVTSWGVTETRDGAPLGWVRTDCRGTSDGGVLHMVQHLTFEHDAPQTRVWTMQVAGSGHYLARANDMVGDAEGEVTGRTFHWRWTLALVPDAVVRRVDMEQWMYRQDDGSVLIRTIVTRLGVTLQEVTERFTQAGA